MSPQLNNKNDDILDNANNNNNDDLLSLMGYGHD